MYIFLPMLSASTSGCIELLEAPQILLVETYYCGHYFDEAPILTTKTSEGQKLVLSLSSTESRDRNTNKPDVFWPIKFPHDEACCPSGSLTHTCMLEVF